MGYVYDVYPLYIRESVYKQDGKTLQLSSVKITHATYLPGMHVFLLGG